MATQQLDALGNGSTLASRRLKAEVGACLASGLTASESLLGNELKAFFQTQFAPFNERKSAEVNEQGSVDAIDEFDLLPYQRVCAQLHSVGLISASEEIITRILFDEIDARVDRLAQASFEQELLRPLRNWVRHCPKGWLKLTLQAGGDATANDNVRHWLHRLDAHAVRSVAAVRCASLMNIVREYPDSMGALDDLRACVEFTGEFDRVVRALNEQYDARLLHLGANTTDIITQFVSTVSALRYVESAGVMLEQVLDPIRSYLRGRDDTIRCMLHAFTDESSELYEEFMHGEASAAAVAPCDDDLFTNDPNEERRLSYRSWQPEPIHAHTSTSRAARQTDTISMLVSVYGSPARFVKEYRNILGERLLSMSSFVVESEVAQAEMFKVRFGEASMAECGIMLKDLGESKRINAHIEQESGVAPLAVVVCSYLSWPTFRTAELKLPPWLAERANRFVEKFRVHKAQRDLAYSMQYGAVELDMHLDGAAEPTSVSCSPVQAMVALCFAKSVNVVASANNGTQPVPVSDVDAEAAVRGLTLDAIVERCGAAADDVRGALAFWAAKRVIKFNTTAGLWQLVDVSPKQQQMQLDNAAEGVRDDDNDDDDEDDDDDDDGDEDDGLDGGDARAAGAGAGGGQESEFAEARMFIVAMLTNLGALPAGRINMMLSNFVSDYSASTDDLTRYLSQMVKEGALSNARVAHIR